MASASPLCEVLLCVSTLYSALQANDPELQQKPEMLKPLEFLMHACKTFWAWAGRVQQRLAAELLLNLKALSGRPCRKAYRKSPLNGVAGYRCVRTVLQHEFG